MPSPPATSVPPAAASPAPAGRPAPAPAARGGRPAAPAAKTGSLMVKSTPMGAAVIVNGKWSGRTPLTRDALPFGDYTVRIVLPGYVTKQERVQLSAACRVTHADGTAAARSGGRCQASRRRKPAAEPPARAGAAVARAGDGRATQAGWTSIRVRPARSVFVDGSAVGTTPLTSAGRDAGSPFDPHGAARPPDVDRDGAGHARQDDPCGRLAGTHSMKAILALENGIWYEGEVGRRAGGDRRRSRLQHQHDRLSGNPDRPVVLRPDRHDDVARDRQLRRRGAKTSSRAAPKVAGFIIRTESPMASNWRADGTLRDYLVRHDIVAISDIDTRALTRVLRSAGVMRGIIATGDVDPRRAGGARAGAAADGRRRPGARRDVRRRRSTGSRHDSPAGEFSPPPAAPRRPPAARSPPTTTA